jgi:hypothetical protein
MIADMLKKLPADHIRIYDNDWETLDLSFPKIPSGLGFASWGRIIA